MIEFALLICSLISILFFVFAIPYMKYVEYKKSKSSFVGIYIPYLGIWVKPYMIYFFVGLLLSVVFVFGEHIGVKGLLRGLRYL